jgi:hypothetical protein
MLCLIDLFICIVKLNYVQSSQPCGVHFRRSFPYAHIVVSPLVVLTLECNHDNASVICNLSQSWEQNAAALTVNSIWHR